MNGASNYNYALIKTTMYSKDYIIRMMEMMAELIAIFLGLLKKGDLQKAAQLLDKVYRDVLKEDASFFKQIPSNDLTRNLLANHHFTNDHLKILSDLFYAEGELQLAKKEKQTALEYFNKSLLLFDFVEQEKATFSFDNEKHRQALVQRIENLKK